MAEYLFQEGKLDNTVHDITYDQIKQLYLDNKREKREGERITASSYRGENYYDAYNNFHFAMQQEYLLRDPKTAGMRMYYPHGVVIEQSMRRNYYRGENQIHTESIPTLHRSLKKFSSRKEQELYRMVADMRIAEFEAFLKKFQHVSDWKVSDVLYDTLAQHYGLETCWLDITSDFNVALFFATCYWDDNQKKWQPLTKYQTEKSAETQYGMLFHMPSSAMVSRWLMNFDKFQIWTNKVIGKTEDGRDQHERLEYPPYRGAMDNLIYPLGFQPFMRCHMQNGYGIYMRTPRPLQSDIGFEKLRFRHNERLSRDVYELMKGGELVYPHEGLKEAEFVIDQIKQLTEFSEEAFLEALYRSHYYRLDDAKQCQRDLCGFLIDGKSIKIVANHPWRLSAGRRKKIDEVYRNFSIERNYGIILQDRKTIPGPNPMFEPWMIPDEENSPGVIDFKVRGTVDCGCSIATRDMLNILQTLMMKRVPDF